MLLRSPPSRPCDQAKAKTRPRTRPPTTLLLEHGPPRVVGGALGHRLGARSVLHVAIVLRGSAGGASAGGAMGRRGMTVGGRARRPRIPGGDVPRASRRRRGGCLPGRAGRRPGARGRCGRGGRSGEAAGRDGTARRGGMGRGAPRQACRWWRRSPREIAMETEQLAGQTKARLRWACGPFRCTRHCRCGASRGQPQTLRMSGRCSGAWRAAVSQNTSNVSS